MYPPSRNCNRSRSRSRGHHGSRGQEPSMSPVRNTHGGWRRGNGGPAPNSPEPSCCLGVFGLSLHTTEDELQRTFSKYGPIQKVQLVREGRFGHSRGFGFVYFQSLENAVEAREQCSGLEIRQRRIRVDYSITRRAHSPTPGAYMGRPAVVTNYNTGGRYEVSPERSPLPRRSPSPRRKRRRRSSGRSRSRSYSPRRR